MSPFSAKVFLKKTFTKDINGNPVKTQCSTEPNIEQITAENKFLNNKVFQLESSSNSLASQYEHTRLGYQHVYQTNVNLLQKVENLQAKLSAAEEENVKLMLSQEERNTEKDNFQLEHQLLNQSLMEEVERLSSQLSGSKVEAIKEIEEVQKQAKQEIKGWKKELGRERSMKINLENKLKLLSVENELVKEKHALCNPDTFDADGAFTSNAIEEEIECTICAEAIPHYKPTIFAGIEMNPACDACKTPSNDNETQSEELNKLAKADLERKHEKVKPKDLIRQKVKEKVEARLKNGEISIEEMRVLEEVLVKELTEEMLNNFGKDHNKDVDETEHVEND